MHTTESNPSEQHLLMLSGEMTIYRATEMAQELNSALMQHRALRLDLSGVSELDTAGVQLLLQVQRDASARGIGLCLGELSQAVQDVFDCLNLSGHFSAATATAAGPTQTGALA